MSPFDHPIVLRPRPSRIARAALTSMGLLALVAIYLADLPLYAAIGAGLTVIAGFQRAWRTPMPLALRLHPDGTLQWRNTAQAWQGADVLPHSSVHPLLCVVAFRPEGERGARAAVFLPDSLDAEDYRRLRVWLRWRVRLEKGATLRPPSGPW